MNTYCDRCRADFDESSVFCSLCGGRLRQSASTGSTATSKPGPRLLRRRYIAAGTATFVALIAGAGSAFGYAYVHHSHAKATHSVALARATGTPRAIPVVTETDSITRALEASNRVWTASMTAAADRSLESAKTGKDLAANLATVQQLAALGEHWSIVTQKYHVDWIHIRGSDKATAQVSKVETGRLYQGTTLMQVLNGPYTVNYVLTKVHGVWKVGSTTVTSTNNRVEFDASSITPTPIAVIPTETPVAESSTSENQAPSSTLTDYPTPTSAARFVVTSGNDGVNIVDTENHVRASISGAGWSAQSGPNLTGGNWTSNNYLLQVWAGEYNDGTSNFSSNPYDFELVDTYGTAHQIATDLVDSPELGAMELPSGSHNAGYIGFDLGSELSPNATFTLMWDEGDGTWQKLGIITIPSTDAIHFSISAP